MVSFCLGTGAGLVGRSRSLSSSIKTIQTEIYNLLNCPSELQVASQRGGNIRGNGQKNAFRRERKTLLCDGRFRWSLSANIEVNGPFSF